MMYPSTPCSEFMAAGRIREKIWKSCGHRQWDKLGQAPTNEWHENRFRVVGWNHTRGFWVQEYQLVSGCCIHILNMKIWNDYQNEGSAIFGSNIMSFGPGPSFHIFDAGDHRWTGQPGAMTSSTSFSMSEQPGLHAFDFPKRWKWVCFFKISLV